MQYVTLKEMPAVLVFKDETYFVYDGIGGNRHTCLVFVEIKIGPMLLEKNWTIPNKT